MASDNEEEASIWGKIFVGLFILAIFLVIIYSFACTFRLKRTGHQKWGYMLLCSILGLFLWPLLLVPIFVYHWK
jgi:hypothetical protein